MKRSPTTASTDAFARRSLFSLGIMTTAMLTSTASLAAPAARLVASRTSGPAPLAVFFDATSTTDSNSAVSTFREIGYRFTFGDSASGNWTQDGKSKNEQIGAPLAAHVFDSPGTYTVQVTAKDAAGATSTASVTITVQSADAAFPGARTVCLSRNSDFAGCPSGAQQVANASAWPSFQSSTRYLLHRGQDFSALSGVRFGAGSNGLNDAQLGAFGSGEKPIVGSVDIVSGLIPDATMHHRVVVMDLDARTIVQQRTGSDLLVYRNTVTRGGMIDFGSAFGYTVGNSTASGWHNPENIFIVDNVVDRNYVQDGGNPNGITGNGVRVAIMGNSVDRTWEHNVRVWQAAKAIVAHNNLTGRCGSSGRHPFKLHGSGLDPVTETLAGGVSPRTRTSQVTVADNLLGSSSSNVNWLATSGPQNNESAEGIEYLVWEDNQFRYGTNYFRDLTWAGRQIVERGNRNVTANRTATFGVDGATMLPADWNGPYFTGQPSMKLRFSGATTVMPKAPSQLIVE